MGLPLHLQIEIESYLCCHKSCDAYIIMPAEIVAQYRKNHDWWYCHRGHQQHFSGKSKEEKLKAELAEKERELQREIKRKEWAQQGEKRAEYQRRAAKGQLTKTKNRIKNGVCPCCNRTFKDLARHMAGQHPDYGKKE
jgi:hypothetical protein